MRKGRGGSGGSKACAFVVIPGVGHVRFVLLGTVYLDSEGEERKMTLLGDTVTSRIRKDPKPDRGPARDLGGGTPRSSDGQSGHICHLCGLF